MLLAEVDSMRITAKLAALPAQLAGAAQSVTKAESQKLLGRVQAKLSDDVLHIRTGALYGSIGATISDDAAKLMSSVGSNGSVPYARIQEYGGRILQANRVIQIPERSYLRSALAEQREAFLDDIRRIVREATQ